MQHPDVIREAGLSGALIRLTKYDPYQALPQHAHPNARLVLVFQGALSETYGRSTVNCSDATLIIRPPELPHSNLSGKDGAACVSMDLPLQWVRVRDGLSSLFQQPSQIRKHGFQSIARRMRQELAVQDSAAGLSLESMILELSAEALRISAGTCPTGPPAWLRRTREYMDDRFRDPITLQELSRLEGVHPVSIAKAFRRHYRCTVAGHLRSLRIEYACSQLLHTDAPLAAIAQDCGFCDQSHFSRHFRSRIGVSPGRYRRNAKIKTSG